jgi:ribonuclease D
MKKTLYNKFDKKAITGLPQVKFPGRIISVISPGETQKAVDYLLSSDILGVDTETKPAFHKGEHHQVSLLQVSNRTTCFLFRLNLTGITPAIKQLLEDTTVKKIGLSWHDDIRGLKERETFKPGLFIDLQNIVPKLGIEDLSLQKLYANIFHQKISKRQRLSNWEAPLLDNKQRQYAAIDAWSCILLYEEILRLHTTHDYELVRVAEPEQPASHSCGRHEECGKGNKSNEEQ